MKAMQHPVTGIPVRSQKMFLATIPCAFTGKEIEVHVSKYTSSLAYQSKCLTTINGLNTNIYIYIAFHLAHLQADVLESTLSYVVCI